MQRRRGQGGGSESSNLDPLLHQLQSPGSDGQRDVGKRDIDTWYICSFSNYPENEIFGEMLQSLKLGKYHGFWNLSLSILFFKVSGKLSKYYPYDFRWPPPGSRVQRVGELPHLLLLRQRLQARPPQCSSPASLLSKVIFDTTFSHLSFIVSKHPCHYKGVFSKCLCLCVCLFGSDHVSSSLWSNVSKVSRIAL